MASTRDKDTTTETAPKTLDPEPGEDEYARGRTLEFEGERGTTYAGTCYTRRFRRAKLRAIARALDTVPAVDGARVVDVKEITGCKCILVHAASQHEITSMGWNTPPGHDSLYILYQGRALIIIDLEPAPYAEGEFNPASTDVRKGVYVMQ